MNIRSLNTYMFYFAVLFLLSGCAAYYPQVVDIPLIKEKGDTRIDIGGFFAPEVNGNADGIVGIHGTASYGITNIMSGQSYLSVDILGRIHVQGALGLFKEFKNKNVIELYGGYGYGSSPFEEIKDDYHLAFSQFNIGRTDLGARHIDYGLGLKGGYLFCNYENKQEPNRIFKENGWIVEPSVFFRFGSKKVKFNTKINYLWTKTIKENYLYLPLNISFGVNFNL